MLQIVNIRHQFRRLSCLYIPKGVHITGDIESISQGIVDGRVDGCIVCGKDITIGVSAILQGNISATNVFIYGKVTGNITATEKVIIYENASVEGLVDCKELIKKETGTLTAPLVAEPIVEPNFLLEKIDGVFVPQSNFIKGKTWF